MSVNFSKFITKTTTLAVSLITLSAFNPLAPAMAGDYYGAHSTPVVDRYAPPGEQWRSHRRYGNRLGRGRYCVSVPRWDHLNVRTGPSTRNYIVARLSNRTCNIRGTGACRRNWCEIRVRGYGRGALGWVNIRYLYRMRSR